MNSPYLGELVAGGTYLLAKELSEVTPSGCPRDCPTGRLCNPDTGFCELPPCGHRCLLNEQCVRDAHGERCEPAEPAPSAP